MTAIPWTATEESGAARGKAPRLAPHVRYNALHGGGQAVAIAAALLPPGFTATTRSGEFRLHKPNAPVAQGTEQRTSNPPVAGSNPAGRAPKISDFAGKTYFE